MDHRFAMNALTRMENAILDEFYNRYHAFRFPRVDEIAVIDRKNTGAGRYTHLRNSGTIRSPDGELPLGRFSHIEIDGLGAGAMVSVTLRAGKLKYLEIVVNGNQFWDGNENVWNIMDPDLGVSHIRSSP